MAVTVRNRGSSSLFLADCPSGNAVGDVVTVSSDTVGGVYQVDQLDILDPSVQLVIGLIVQKLSATRCVVQTGGEVVDLYTGLTPGKALFVDDMARLTQSVPTHPALGVRWNHLVAYALSSNSLMISIQRPMKLIP
jgi:hypothetical protein